jgi:hypothetical protein
LNEPLKTKAPFIAGHSQEPARPGSVHRAWMHLRRPRVSATAAPPSPEAAWDEAFLRVESYLRAHHLTGRVLLNEVVADIIREARERNAGEAPVTTAMRITHLRIGAWFASVGNAGDWSDVRVRLQGRLALVLADVPGRWSSFFLSSEAVPPEMAAALAHGVLVPGPELRLSSMPAAPLEFGLGEPQSLGLIRHGMRTLLRQAAVWLAIVGVLGAAWAASH